MEISERPTAEEIKRITLLTAQEMKKQMIEKWEQTPIIIEIFEQIKQAALDNKFKLEINLENKNEAILTIECFRALGYNCLIAPVSSLHPTKKGHILLIKWE